MIFPLIAVIGSSGFLYLLLFEVPELIAQAREQELMVPMLLQKLFNLSDLARAHPAEVLLVMTAYVAGISLLAALARNRPGLLSGLLVWLLTLFPFTCIGWVLLGIQLLNR